MTPAQLAQQRTREILQVVPQVQQLVIDSPPGAGKTGVAERLAIQAAWLQGQRVMIATQTNAQALDLARRIASTWKRHNVMLFTRRGLPLPAEVEQLVNRRRLEDQGKNLWVIHDARTDFPTDGPCVIIANSRKWSYARLPEEPYFDLMIVEEAYQLRDAEFQQIAGMADRHVLVGDPGQIDPVTSAATTRWSTDPFGPHVPAPRALLARRPATTHRMKLPVSRRLPHDTVQIIQPAFYPDLPFQATSAPGDRALHLAAARPEHTCSVALDRAASGSSLLLCELPALHTGEHDAQLAGTIVSMIIELLQRDAEVTDFDPSTGSHSRRALPTSQIGVVCGHRSQVYAVQELLAAAQPVVAGHDLSRVLVETSDRFQGLERQVMFAWHPLSGRATAGSFQLDAGRLCVMLSRHRIACFVVSREGAEQMLTAAPAPVARTLGTVPDTVFEGMQAHLEMLRLLREERRVVSL